MKTWIAAVFAVGLASQAVAYQDYSMTETLSIGQRRVSTSALQDAQNNYAGPNAGKVGHMVGVSDLRLATISATLLYPPAVFTQFTFVFPNNVRRVRIQTRAGTGTNFCHAGWSSSTTGSAPTAGTIEAFSHLPRIAGAANLSAVASQATPSSYTWDNIQTKGGFSTLFCGCQDTAAIGVGAIEVEYMAP